MPSPPPTSSWGPTPTLPSATCSAWSAKVGLEIGGAVISRAARRRRYSASSAAVRRRTSGACPAASPRGSKRRSSKRSGRWSTSSTSSRSSRSSCSGTSCSPTRPTSTSSSTGLTPSTCRTWAWSTRTTRRTSTTARCASSTSRARSCTGTSAVDYADYVAEHVEPWSYLKFPYLKKRGWKGFVEGIDSSIYCATPLARLNVADRMASPKAQEAYEEMFATLGGHPCRALLASHWARLVEMVQNAEALKSFCDDPEITGDRVQRDPAAGHRRGHRHRRGHARDADASLHLRRERHLHERQPHRRHDQQQRAHPDGHQEGRPAR